MRAARSWSSQKPGSPICASSSARRIASASGSKVITDPREAGSDLLELLAQRLVVLLGHAAMVAGLWAPESCGTLIERMATTRVEELVGREEELAAIDAFVDRAAAGPAALLIEGEA